jgi:integrase
MKSPRSKVPGVYWRPRASGEETVRLPNGERQRGAWWISWTCRDGHLHREPIGPKQLAIDTYQDRKARTRADGYCPRRAQADHMTIEDVLQAVVDDYTANGRRALGEVTRHKGRLARYFGATRDASELRPGEVDAYAAHRRKAGAAVATVNRELACLRRALRLAHRRGRLATVPYIATTAEHNVRTGFFEEPEFQALRQAAEPHVRPLFTFLYLTGWRVGEVLPLQWRQVDLSAGVVRLEPGTTKNRDGRTLPSGAVPELGALLTDQRERTREVERQTGRIIPWVFHRDGTPIGPRGLRLAWRRATKAANLPERIPHDFRRTAVRNLERAGVPRSVAMKLTGHKTEHVYRRYAIVAERDLAEGLAKLAALRERTAGQVVPLRPGAHA